MKKRVGAGARPPKGAVARSGRGRMPRLEPGDRVEFEDRGSPYVVRVVDGELRLWSEKGRRFDHRVSPDLYEERLRWREGWMHVTKKTAAKAQGAKEKKQPKAQFLGKMLVLKRGLGTISPGKYLAQAFQGTEWTLVRSDRVVFFATDRVLRAAYRDGKLTVEAPPDPAEARPPLLTVLSDEVRACRRRVEDLEKLVLVESSRGQTNGSIGGAIVGAPWTVGDTLVVRAPLEIGEPPPISGRWYVYVHHVSDDKWTLQCIVMGKIVFERRVSKNVLMAAWDAGTLTLERGKHRLAPERVDAGV